jgi:hypothetical protein
MLADMTFQVGERGENKHELGSSHAFQKRILPNVGKSNCSILGDLQVYLAEVDAPTEPFNLIRSVARWVRRTSGEIRR